MKLKKTCFMKLKLSFTIAILFLSVGVYSQDLKKAKKVEKSNSEKSVELRKETKRGEKPSTISIEHEGEDVSEESENSNSTLDKDKVFLKESLSSYFEEITSKKGQTENWSSIEERYLQKINQELDDYPFTELKLSFQDSVFREWFIEAESINDLRLYNRYMKILSESL